MLKIDNDSIDFYSIDIRQDSIDEIAESSYLKASRLPDTRKLRGEGHPLLATLALGYIDEAEFRAIAGKHHPEIDVEGWCNFLREY
jgi:hypothetical protein